MNCRHCRHPLTQLFLDLGYAPPSNAYLTKNDLVRPEITYPLRLYVCSECHLVQTDDYAAADSFFTADYAYFSSTSRSWLDHAKRYSVMISQRLSLTSDSFVIEIASNDGYLLRNFVDADVPCLGIEPTGSTATAAEAIGVPTQRSFFGEALARTLVKDGKQADLIIGNNVFAHVPDINDFSLGLYLTLKPEGVVTLEFPHLMRLIEFRQFDTVYHEHFSYLSLLAAKSILEKADLRLFDIEELPTHGGSLRIYACRKEASHPTRPSVAVLLAEEIRRDMDKPTGYMHFQDRADAAKNDLLEFLLRQKKAGRSVAGYGAAAKGNTLMNYAGIKTDLLPFICDMASAKQNKFTPGGHIPILPLEILEKKRPDYLWIIPWNIADEVRSQFEHLARQGTKFVTALPEVKII